MATKQDRATTERHAKTLREQLKKTENKYCADCKRNDPRWASWNLGVYLCIRCSGIHRSMGTHISKVKSVDLDVWTPEQMANITKWGNYLANLYWEAHLKPGHVPPEHKMESFIRSKYESRRWAKEGPLPSDPSVLEDGSSAPATTSSSAPISAPAASIPAVQRAHTPTASVSSIRAPGITTRQPQPHQLLSTAVAGRAPAAPSPLQSQPAAPAAAPAPAAPSASNDLFSLDFHNPTPPAAAPAPKKDAKQDILSLFSTPAPAAAPASNAFGQFGGQQQNVWGGQQWGGAPVAAAAVVQPAQPQVTSLVGNNGTGMWGASSGWNATPVAAQPQPNLWGGAPTQPPTQQPQQNLMNTNDIWGSSGSSNTTGGDLFGSPLPGMQKKDDVFGDIWGGFK